MTYKPQDSYYKKAKQEGYRSRAAYKLLELQQRFGQLAVNAGLSALPHARSDGLLTNTLRRLLKKISEARRAKNRRAEAYLAGTLERGD